MNNYLNLLPEDLVVKILDKRCDDIQNDLDKLEYKLMWFEDKIEGLSITKKTPYELEKELQEYIDNGEEYQGGLNNKYDIYFGNLQYSSTHYLYETIYIGKVVMSYTIIYYDDEGEIDDYSLFEKSIINPTIFDLLRFTSHYIDEDTSHRFVEGFDLKKKASRIDKDGNQFDTISLSLGS